MLKFDPQHEVNYFQLKQEHYLKEEPKIQFYITDLDGLITHIKPQKKKMENTSHSWEVSSFLFGALTNKSIISNFFCFFFCKIEIIALDNNILKKRGVS
jgi:hypothetical protein